MASSSSSSSLSRPWPSSSSSGSSSASSSRPILGRLILLRHPNTEANAAGILQGSTDSPLTPHGERQLERLCAFFRQDEDGKDVEGKQGVVAGGWAVDELPTMIAHSPLERCARLARGVAGVVGRRRERAREEEEDDDDDDDERQPGVDDDDDQDGPHGSPPTPSSSLPTDSSDGPASSRPTATPPSSRTRTPLLYPSIDLQEKNFGPLECTRRGVHAGPSFPHAPPNAKREADEQFRNRVRRSMRLWVTKLVKRGREVREEWELELETGRMLGEVGREPPTPPTLLVVTHGMFISTALRILQPSISPNSPDLSVDSPVSFADNTGMFLLEVVAAGTVASTDAGAWSLRLVRANWAPHLVGLTRPSKKGAALAAAGADRRQRKLDGFFGAGRQEGKRKREDDAAGEEEQQQARR